MRITPTALALLLHHAARADKASKGPAKGGKGNKKGKSGKATAAPTGAPTGVSTEGPTAAPTGAPTGVSTEGPTAAPTGALCTDGFNNTSLREAVKGYFVQECTTKNATCGIITQYGVIGGWRVSCVTDMTDLFSSFKYPEVANFNQPLNNWDVSKVTTMRSMLYGAAAYNQPMNGWNVSNVINMYYMFEASAFNQPLNDWDVSKVTTMQGLFYDATAYNQPLCDWGTKLQKTADVNGMFSGSGCANKAAPNLTLVPPGPFCAVCPGLF
jgi:surface protein